ncbi:MAG: helix-turn-helix domain-containing protein [Defluviimonas denitrificans]
MMCFEEWNNCILSNCGHYYSTPLKHARKNVGYFQLRRRHGVDIAEMQCEIDQIERQRVGIRRDDHEYLFLLMPKSGEMNVVHNGRQEVLTPGDSLLMDSTRTAELNFNGRAASFLSVHLPRSLCLEGGTRDPATGRRIARAHPLRASLSALIDGEGPDEAHADYLFDFIAMMFRAEDRSGDVTGFRDRHGRFRYICDTIERHVADSDFTVERLAGLVHMSRRQLQRDFRDNGTTFTRVLCERRMKLVVSHLRRAAGLKLRPAISDLAYRAGFSDLSHFNRSFRQLYDVSPGGYYEECLRSLQGH